VGWVVRGQMVKNFEAASFAQKIGDISPQLVETEYGVHIVQVQERQEPRVQPFEEVKAQLGTEFKKAQVVDRMQNAIDQARAALAKAPASYEAIARQYGLELVKGDKVIAGSPVPGIPEGPELETNLQSLKPGDVSQVFQLSPTKLAIAEITASTPSRIATFEEAESHIREKFTEQRAQVLAGERAKQAADRVKAGEDMQKVAKETGGEYKVPDAFNADGAVEGLGAGNVFHEGFEKPAGAVIGPLNVIGQQVIAKTVEKIPADTAAFAAERDKLVLQLKQKKSAQSKDLFQDSILARLIREGKVKKHEDTIKRMMAAYRSS
jgi:peptidyl-prolyl cis-trans isomerase D